MQTILLIHGPNLNKLGRRESELYGHVTLLELENLVSTEALRYGFKIKPIQSNHEGVLIDWLQVESDSASGIIINPGAFTHYSYALHDAIMDTGLPAVEVHISDIQNREEWRKNSVIVPACIAQIYGKKIEGYVEAVDIIARYIAKIKK